MPSGEINAKSGRVLASAFVAAMTNSQTLSSFAIAIFMQPLAQELGWSRGEIGAGVTFSHWGMAIGAAIAGRFVDRLGPRAIMIPLTAVAGLAVMSLSLTAGSILLFYAANLIAGVCVPGSAAYAKMLSLWFHARRGLAISALGVGSFVTIMALPPIGNWLLGAIGWRSTYLVLGGTILLISLPVLTLFFREPEGARKRAAAGAPLLDDAPTMGVRQSLAASTFWLLLGTQVGATFAYSAFNTHAMGVFGEHGLTTAQAAFGLTLVGGGGLVAQLMAGLLLDRFDTPRILLPFAGLALIGLLLVHVTHARPLLYFGALLFGLGCGGEVSTTAYFITRFYGVRNFATIYGVMKPVLMCCAAPAPFFMGALVDRTGAYGPGLLLCEAMLVLCLACYLLLPRYPFAAGDTIGIAPQTPTEGLSA